MKNKKILTALTAAFLALAMVLIPGCGGFPGLDFDKLASGLEGLVSELGNMAEDWEKYASARENLTNFKIAIETTDENNNTSVLTEARTENGYALIADKTVTYVEYAAGKMYSLNIPDKTGISFKLENEQSYKSFGMATAVYLYAFEAFRLLGAKKTGTEKIAGRDANIYTYELGTNECKFWIDGEYGLTLKSIMKDQEGIKTMEVKEFKIGGVNLADFINLGEYSIKDSPELMN